MMKNTEYTVCGMLQALADGKITSEKLVTTYLKNFENDQSSTIRLNAFLEIYGDAIEQAKSCDAERAHASAKGKDALTALLAEKPLLGIPFAVKDNISVKGKKLTCASHLLEGYVAPYNATVIQRLSNAGAIPLGRCNQDEFAMGSSTEYSSYGPTRNPINREYVSGGSSGGSAAAVAAGMAPFSLGTETGGSVRLPASYCGIYGLKPTYGVLSRWGVVSFASSFDQVGLFGRTPADIALPLAAMVGVDFYDDTSCDLPNSKSLSDLTDFAGIRENALHATSKKDFSALKIAIPHQFVESKGLDPEVAQTFEDVKKWFESKGSSINIVDIPILDTSIACYYVIALSEAASNLSRFDGIRYGNRKDSGDGYDELYIKTRSEGFGAEVKRRIIIGNYALSEQFSGDCYKKAMSVRARMQREVAALYQKYDIILCPTCPTAAFKLGQKVDDPLEMYLSDLFTIFVNLSRTAAVSIPAGKKSNGLPIGVQFAGPMFSEPDLLALAQAWENDHPYCGFAASLTGGEA